MRTRQPVLAPTDVEQTIPEVHLVPAKRNQFGDAQAMAIGELDHRGIPVAVASQAFRRAKESVHRGRGEILSAPPGGMGPLTRWQDAMCDPAWDGRGYPSRDSCGTWARGEGRAGHSVLRKYFPEMR